MIDKKLVFRIADVGFALSLTDLVEIREAGPGVLDRTAADPEGGLLGVICHHDDAIQALNIRQRVGLPAPDSYEAAYVVVNGADGVWALPVDRVEGIFPAAEFRTAEVPLLLGMRGELPYRSLAVWRSEPLIRFEPQAFEGYGVGG